MLQVRVIPSLLVKDGKLVKTVRFKDANYVGDPVNAIKIYNEKEVDELVVLDITATREGKEPPFELIRRVAGECFMPLAYGGGIRSLQDMRRIFNLGVEKIILNSYAVENPDFIQDAARIFGNQSVVVSIDAKRKLLGGYTVVTAGGTKKTKLNPVEWARRAEELGAGEILLTSVDRDGTWEGYDLELIQQVCDAVDNPVIAAGGAGKIEDFRHAVDAGASAVAAGSMVVYQGVGLGVLVNFPRRDRLEAVLK